MMFEAIIFLAGAVLFFLGVVFYIVLWQDRAALARQKDALRHEVTTLKEQRIDLEIREHELTVWAEGLDHQQKAIEQAERELRMLTASKQAPVQEDDRRFVVDTAGEAHTATEKDDQERSVLKNLKEDAKLSSR